MEEYNQAHQTHLLIKMIILIIFSTCKRNIKKMEHSNLSQISINAKQEKNTEWVIHGNRTNSAS